MNKVKAVMEEVRPVLGCLWKGEKRYQSVLRVCVDEDGLGGSSKPDGGLVVRSTVLKRMGILPVGQLEFWGTGAVLSCQRVVIVERCWKVQSSVCTEDY